VSCTVVVVTSFVMCVCVGGGLYCVGVLVMCVLVFVVLCIVCTLFLYRSYIQVFIHIFNVCTGVRGY
jgi:hypothetical protein